MAAFIRAEYRTSKDNSDCEVDELVVYEDRTNSIRHIPTSSIILTHRLSSSEYYIVSLHQEDAPPTFKPIGTTVNFLPENFLETFPLYQGPSTTLKAIGKEHMQYSDEPRIHVLLCANSGTGLARDFYTQVLKLVLVDLLGLEEGKDFDVHETTHPQFEGPVFARDVLLPAANAGKKKLVLLLSGDGGISDLLNDTLGRGVRESTYVAPSICLFPLGTANALFHSIHRSSTTTNPLVNSLRTLLNGTSRPLPTFTATFSPNACIMVDEGRKGITFDRPLYGAVVASYGFHATLVADSDTAEYRKHGIARFGMIAKELLDDEKGGPHPYKCTIETKPHLENASKSILSGHEFGYILLTLVSNLEQTFTISPASQPVDGKLRAVIFGPQSGKKVMELMGGAYAGGKHVEDKADVFYEPVESLVIDFEEEGESSKWRRACIDGKIVAVPENGYMTVENGGPANGMLEVLVPGK